MAKRHRNPLGKRRRRQIRRTLLDAIRRDHGHFVLPDGSLSSEALLRLVPANVPELQRMALVRSVQAQCMGPEPEGSPNRARDAHDDGIARRHEWIERSWLRFCGDNLDVRIAQALARDVEACLDAPTGAFPKRHEAAMTFLTAARAFASGGPWSDVEKAAYAWIGWKRHATWLAHVRSDPPVLTRCAADHLRRAQANERAREVQKARMVREGRPFLTYLKQVLVEHGSDEAILADHLRHLGRMLPDGYALPRGAFAALNACDPEDPMAKPFTGIPGSVLWDAWADSWVTARTVADSLAISLENARRAMRDIGTREVPNPHDRAGAPMLLCRMSQVREWARSHTDRLDAWQRTLKARHAARDRRTAAEVERVRAIRDRLQELHDEPAALACFWLSLLNRAAKTPGHDMDRLYRTKDRALRRLVAAGVACDIRFVHGGDREAQVWLCERCRQTARDMGMHPIDYIDLLGACRTCRIQPAVEGYYDLYALIFTFSKASFSFHIPARLGRAFLPVARPIPTDNREEQGWGFGRPLSKAEARAFSLEEIQNGLSTSLSCLERESRSRPT